jgi:hypothetical protein
MSWERDREHGYEAQFAQQEEEAFKVAAHRNHLLAHWAAKLMGLRHRDTESYVKTLVTGDVAHLRGRAVIDTIVRDLRAAGVTMSEGQVAAMFNRLDVQARAELAER